MFASGHTCFDGVQKTSISVLKALNATSQSFRPDFYNNGPNIFAYTIASSILTSIPMPSSFPARLPYTPKSFKLLSHHLVQTSPFTKETMGLPLRTTRRGNLNILNKKAQRRKNEAKYAAPSPAPHVASILTSRDTIALPYVVPQAALFLS